MTRPTLYLSGPMSGLPEFNFPAFHAAAEQLRGVGYTVISPAEAAQDLTAPWAEHLRRDIALMMAHCTAVATLPGWEHSKGAQLEVHIARELGWPVMPASVWLAFAVDQRMVKTEVTP
jgi:hypothetical protein